MSAGRSTDEQRALTAAVADSCRREAGTREQRSFPSDGGLRVTGRTTWCSDAQGAGSVPPPRFDAGTDEIQREIVSSTSGLR